MAQAFDAVDFGTLVKRGYVDETVWTEFTKGADATLIVFGRTELIIFLTQMAKDIGTDFVKMLDESVDDLVPLTDSLMEIAEALRNIKNTDAGVFYMAA